MLLGIWIPDERVIIVHYYYCDNNREQLLLFENSRKERYLIIQKNLETVVHSLVGELDNHYNYLKVGNGEKIIKVRIIANDIQLRITEL